MSKEKMSKTLDDLISKLIGFRSGTISPAFIDTVKMSYNGQMTPISKIAITTKAQNGVSVMPHDSNMCNGIVKCLKDAGMNAYLFSKNNVMVTIPPISGEEITKVHNQIKKLGEDAKIAVRNIRKNMNNDIKKLPKEAKGKQEKNIQKLTDEYIAKIDDCVDKKTREIR